MKAATAAGTTVKIVAPKVGGAKLADGSMMAADGQLAGTPPVLFDAVAVILSDFWPHGALAKSLGILRAEGFSERANILLDEAGKVMFVKVYPIRQLPDIGEILTALKS